MKRILSFLVFLCIAFASAGAGSTTLNPIQLLNPSGSTSGQAIVSTGPSSAPSWGSISAGSISGTIPIANGGTNAATAAGALTNLGADAVGSTSNKDVYVSTAGNDSNNGTSWGYAKLTLQAAVNAANPGGTVHVGAGTYTLTANLAMQPGVKLLCTQGATITQGNAQNLTALIDFSVNSANGASVQGCTVDGNRANNTNSGSVFLLNVGGANDVNISNNTIQNGNGYGIDVATGLRPVIAYNKMSNFYVGPIFIITGVGQTATYGQIVHNTLYGNVGSHAITLNESDWNLVSANSITAPLQTGMTVNTSGTTVTLTAGPNFASVSPGSFIILNGGAEFLITSVTDNTHLVVNTTPGTLTGVPAAIGSGDLLSLGAASHNTISANTITGGVGGGIVISNFIGGESTAKNNVIGNTISGTGEGCIEIESENNFSTQVFDTQINSNSLADCGLGTTAVASNTLFGIALIDFSTNTLLSTYINGNYIRDDQGTPTTVNWLGIQGVTNGQVFVGRNTNVGTTNNGISGGITSVSLGAGWGSTATATATSYGEAFYVTITSNGTGQAAGPTVTVNTRATTANNPPVMVCQFVGGTGTANFAFGQTPGVNTSPALTLFVYAGTPSAGGTYNFICRG